MALSDNLFDENGNFLGRDFKSWAKILGFYAVYYTFLAILFYGFTMTYYLESRVLTSNPVGGKPAVANPRLDMPGAVVHPFREMQKARGDINRIDLKEEAHYKDYCAKLLVYFQGKQELNEGAEDCSQGDITTKTSTCKVEVDNLMGAKCMDLLEVNKPMFTIDINKIIGWSPNNAGIHFDCYEYDMESGDKLAKQEYKVEWLENTTSIAHYYFPYNGVSSKQLIKLPSGQQSIPNGEATEGCATAECEENKPFNKPFVAGTFDKPLNADKDGHMFRCDILSDKITMQQYDNKESSRTTNNELRGLQLGFVEFGYIMPKLKDVKKEEVHVVSVDQIKEAQKESEKKVKKEKAKKKKKLE